ncbi:MAG: hypothetical protein U9N10_11495 [Bacillota bacterium]|nr:hypothetical protein [Bacillota bacterium]
MLIFPNEITTNSNILKVEETNYRDAVEKTIEELQFESNVEKANIEERWN